MKMTQRTFIYDGRWYCNLGFSVILAFTPAAAITGFTLAEQTSPNESRRKFSLLRMPLSDPGGAVSASSPRSKTMLLLPLLPMGSSNHCWCWCCSCYCSCACYCCCFIDTLLGAGFSRGFSGCASIFGWPICAHFESKRSYKYVLLVCVRAPFS